MRHSVLAPCGRPGLPLCFPVVNIADVVRQRVRERLAALCMSDADLAREMKRTGSWISNFMSGKKSVPLDTLQGMAEVLKTTVSYLTSAQAGA